MYRGLFEILTWDHASVVCEWRDVQLDFGRHLDFDLHAKRCVEVDVHGGLPENQNIVWQVKEVGKWLDITYSPYRPYIVERKIYMLLLL